MGSKRPNPLDLSDLGLSSSLSRSRQDRRIILGLIALLFFGLILYLTITLSGASATRTRQAANRNETTARLCAQLLEEQCKSAFSVLRSLVGRPSLEASMLRGERAEVIHSLRDAVELVPDLLVTAVYSREGNLIGKFPDEVSLPSNITKESWFKQLVTATPEQLPSVNGVVRLPIADNAEAFTIAIPVRSKQQEPVGYLLAYFRLGNFYDWLKSVRFSSGTVMLVDNGGRVVATSSDSKEKVDSEESLYQRRIIRSGYAPYEKARKGKQGAEVSSLPSLLGSAVNSTARDQLVGYALASLPGWVVLVVQPTEAAFAPSQYLLRRLAIVGIPLLLAVPLVGWSLVQLYERLQRLAFALGQRNELLRQLIEAKSELLANVSHDLKTPISSMQISVSSLLETDEETGKLPDLDPQLVHECLTLVSQELDMLAAQVRNLLDMSRLEFEKAPILREPCDLTDIVANARDRVRPLAGGRVIKSRFPGTPLMVVGDPGQLETVILNLLENAIKYSPADSPITLEGSVESNKVSLRVSDQGEGLPPGDEERVFEKFYRVGTSTSVGGTGLGLAICKTIIEAHEGVIHAQTLPEGGAEFHVTLPSWRGPSSEEGQDSRRADFQKTRENQEEL